MKGLSLAFAGLFKVSGWHYTLGFSNNNTCEKCNLGFCCEQRGWRVTWIKHFGWDCLQQAVSVSSGQTSAIANLDSWKDSVQNAHSNETLPSLLCKGVHKLISTLKMDPMIARKHSCIPLDNLQNPSIRHKTAILFIIGCEVNC